MEAKRGRPSKRGNRKERFGLGSARPKLSVDPELIPEGKVARWLNDKGMRLAEAQSAGYVFVDDPAVKIGDDVENGRDTLSTKVCRVVGTKEDGTPLKAYLMVIDKDDYEENQRVKQEGIDEIDNVIRHGGIGDTDGRYIPNEGIKIDNKH